MNKLARKVSQHFEKRPSDIGWILAATAVCACIGTITYERKNVEPEPIAPMAQMIPTNAASWETFLRYMR